MSWQLRCEENRWVGHIGNCSESSKQQPKTAHKVATPCIKDQQHISNKNIMCWSMFGRNYFWYGVVDQFVLYTIMTALSYMHMALEIQVF